MYAELGKTQDSFGHSKELLSDLKASGSPATQRFVRGQIKQFHAQLGVGQNTTTRGPQVLVFGSVYQG